MAGALWVIQTQQGQRTGRCAIRGPQTIQTETAKATGCNEPAPRGEVFFGLHMAVSLKVFLVDRRFAIGLNQQHFVRVFAAFVDRAIHAR
jgi:hypothetical protein